MASPDCGYPSPWEWRHLSRPQASSGELAKGKVPDTPRCPPALGHPDPLGALASRRAQASERDETPDFSLLVAEAEAEAEVLQEQTAQLEVVAQVEASPRGVREVGIQCVDRMSLATNTVQCHRRSLANSGECIGGQPPDARRRLASIIRPYGAPPACETSVGDACAFAAADEDASWDGCEVACSDDRMAQEIAESSAQGSSPQACRAPERNALDRREVGVGSFSRISALSAMSSGCNSPPAVTAEEEAERSTAPRHEELSRCHVGHAGTLPAPAAPDAALGQLEYPRWRSDSSSQSFVEFGAGPSTTEMRAALENIPTKQFKARIVVIFKKGNIKNSANYRPISLLNSLYRIFAAVIQRRLSGAIDHKLQKAQYGFRREPRMAQAIHLIRCISDVSERGC